MTATEPAPVSPPAPPPGIGTPATAEEIGKVCPVCQTAVAEGERVQNCAACGQLHHGACWEEVGGCATYGCANAHETVKPQESAQPTSAWGDTKKCPACGETIKAIALRCRYCNSDFPTIDPMTAADLRKRAWNADEAKSTRTATIVLFAFSLIGIFAPIMVIVCLVWMWPNRKKIEKAGPAFLVLGYAALGLSVIYSLMMLMFFALS